MQKEKLKEIIERLCNDTDFDVESAWFVMDLYLTQSQEIIEEANGILLNVNDTAFFKIEGLMHKLKGSSGNVRSNIVMNLSIEAEQLAKMHKKESLMLHLVMISSIIEDYRKERDSIILDLQ